MKNPRLAINITDPYTKITLQAVNFSLKWRNNETIPTTRIKSSPAVKLLQTLMLFYLCWKYLFGHFHAPILMHSRLQPRRVP